MSWALLAPALLLGSGAPAVAARIDALARAGRLPGRPRGARSVGPAAVRRIGGPLAVAAAGVFGAWLGGAAIALAALAVSGAAWRAVVLIDSGRRARAAVAEVRRAVRVMVGELEAGAGPPAALRAAADAAGSCASPFASAAALAARGESAGAALTAAGPGLPPAAVAAFRTLGHAWEVGECTGAPLAGVFARVAGDLAAAERQRRAVDVVLAGPRSSAALLAGLPLLGIGLGAAMGASPGRFLLRSGAGSAVCLLGVVFDLAGIAWMARIIERARRG